MFMRMTLVICLSFQIRPYYTRASDQHLLWEQHPIPTKSHPFRSLHHPPSRMQVGGCVSTGSTTRQAGMHAERINVLFDELLHGHLWSEEDLREVIGHTPLEVAGGVLLGLIVGAVQWLIWP